MRRKVSLLGTILGFLLIGCSTPTTAQHPASTHHQPATQMQPPSNSTPKKPLGQTLPISAIATIAGKKIELEVAKTPVQQATGLMYRTSLADNRGMLFLFSPPQPIAFWMKNTLIPLDMVFVRDGVVQALAQNVPPCKSDPCPAYPSIKTIDSVIELRGGLTKELGLKVGDRITITDIEPKASL